MIRTFNFKNRSSHKLTFCKYWDIINQWNSPWHSISLIFSRSLIEIIYFIFLVIIFRVAWTRMECNIVNIESIKPSYNTYKELVQKEKGNYQKLKYVFRKRYSETMQQIYKRMTMPKCGFNKVALQLYWNHTLAWMFSCKFAAYFQNYFL